MHCKSRETWVGELLKVKWKMKTSSCETTRTLTLIKSQSTSRTEFMTVRTGTGRRRMFMWIDKKTRRMWVSFQGNTMWRRKMVFLIRLRWCLNKGLGDKGRSWLQIFYSRITRFIEGKGKLHTKNKRKRMRYFLMFLKKFKKNLCVSRILII